MYKQNKEIWLIFMVMPITWLNLNWFSEALFGRYIGQEITYLLGISKATPIWYKSY